MEQTSYQQTLEFLFNQLPMFQREGASAYKPGLDTTLRLSELFGNPHNNIRCIHIAGTNGKGSTAHTIAAVLQSAGYKVGLFTSPHLIDFRERIRVNGEMIGERDVIEFVAKYRDAKLSISPTFFELTTIMAFDYFNRQDVDVAVIEVGLGGRLDSTNIITPDLSVITNISFDHTALLGNTLEAIAREKAGIIKPHVPVVIGEAEGGVRNVFVQKAEDALSPITFAQDVNEIISTVRTDGVWHFTTNHFGNVYGELGGDCQRLNAATILTALMSLREIGYKISQNDVHIGFAKVNELTGLMGRWMIISKEPFVVCDTGHNPGGWQYLSKQLAEYDCHKRLVIGFVGDKDVTSILEMMSHIPDARYYFTSPSVRRAMPASSLSDEAMHFGLKGDVFDSVEQAYKKALADSDKGDMLFIGGSSYVVADLLTYLHKV